MENAELFNKLESNTILSNIFDNKEEQLYAKIEKYKKIEMNKSKKISYDIINQKLEDNLPNCEDIKKYIEEYFNQENLISSYENEKFYKEGFSDAIQLILECIGNNYTSKNK